ncbi:hypothetical protein [Micromonospora sp. NPDC005367]|uniref:hypothetical protein n=1 Tax=Micromonospora sp. NPDC005367 TaxID=3155590 RepID=UPI0033B0BAFA
MSTAQRAAIRRINGQVVHADGGAIRPSTRSADAPCGNRFPETRMTRRPTPIITE